MHKVAAALQVRQGQQARIQPLSQDAYGRAVADVGSGKLNWDVILPAAKAAGAAKPDDKAVKAAFKKLDESCAKCHAVFRD